MNCLNALIITTSVGSPWFQRIIPGLYKYDTIVSNLSTFDWHESLLGIVADTFSPIILEGNSVTLLPNFLADQSTFMQSYVYIDQPGPILQNSNGYLLIEPLKCDDDLSDFYNWFRKMPDDSATTKNTPTGSSITDVSIITIAPNPVYSMVNITYPCNLTGALEITITDVLGSIVYAATVNCTDGNTVQQSIDMSSYQQGVYFITLTLSNEHVVKKIVKL